MKILFIFSLLFLGDAAFSQNPSLSKSFTQKIVRNDSNKVKIYLEASEKLLRFDKKKAKVYAQKALELSKRYSTASFKAQSLLTFAKAIRSSVDINILFKYDEDAIEQAKLTGSQDVLFDAENAYTQDLIVVSTNISKILEMLNRLKLYSEQDITYATKLKYEFTQGLYDYRTRKMSEALNHFEGCLQLSEKANNKKMIADSKTKIFQTKLFSGIVDTTAELAFEALDYYTTNNYPEEAAYCKFVIGDSYRLHGNVAKAVAYYNEAYPVATKYQNNIVAAGIQIAFIQTYMMQENYNLEKSAIGKAEKHYVTLNFEGGLGIVKCFWAQYYSGIGDYEKANKLFDETESMGKRLNYPPLIGANLQLRTQHLEKQHKTKEADSVALKAYESAAKYESKEAINNLYKHTDNYSKTQKKLYFDSTFRKNKGRKILELLRETSKKKGDSIMPLYQPLLSSFDSIQSSAYNTELVNIETKYKTRLVTDSLHQEQQKTIIAKQKIRNNNIILLSVAAISLLLLAGFALQYRNRKRAENDRQHIQTLQNEIHHRVKNNLGVIQRLVDVAGKNAVDEVPLSSLKTRIKSIELLHTHLYGQKAKPGNISLQAYLEDLCLAIAATFQTGKDIKIKINASEELDSHIAERLGLIINELVTNSYKYAFEGKDEGIINITAQKEEKIIQIAVEDNGVGFETEKNKSSYGMKLIKGLSHELNGKYFFSNNGGTRFHLNIPV